MLDDIFGELVSWWPVIVRLDHSNLWLVLIRGCLTADMLLVMMAYDTVLTPTILLLLEVIVMLGLRR